jgi:SAM-dependent methyltransferase
MGKQVVYTWTKRPIRTGLDRGSEYHDSLRLWQCHRKNQPVREFRGFPATLTQLTLAGRNFELLVPADGDQLVDIPDVVERFEDDEYLPYWAQIWPASLLLADAVATWGGGHNGRPGVLEIGCGLGLVSLVLSHLGYRVVASDYDEDALAFVVENARRNGLPIPQTRRLDWRGTYAGVLFERIVAADVLYETRQLRPVAEFVHAHLKPGGLALVADPNRTTADDFGTVARHCGLNVRTTAVERTSATGDRPIRGRLFHLWHKR